MSPCIMGLTTQDPYIQKEIVTNVWIAGHLSGNPYISLQILKFLNGCILFNLGPINTKLKDFVKLSVLFLHVNPIIHGLIPRPSRYEIQQCLFSKFASRLLSALKMAAKYFIVPPLGSIVTSNPVALWLFLKS